MNQKMKVAVTYDDGQVYQHFGHTAQFKVYDVENGKVQTSEILDTEGNGHGALAEILKRKGVDALICGGIGAGAKRALAEAKIDLYGGVEGEADQVIEKLITNKLVYKTDAECNHHHHESRHGCQEKCSCHSH